MMIGHQITELYQKVTNSPFWAFFDLSKKKMSLVTSRDKLSFKTVAGTIYFRDPFDYTTNINQ